MLIHGISGERLNESRRSPVHLTSYSVIWQPRRARGGTQIYGRCDIEQGSSGVQRQTSVTAYFSSKQLLLFAFARHNGYAVTKEICLVNAYKARRQDIVMYTGGRGWWYISHDMLINSHPSIFPNSDIKYWENDQTMSGLLYTRGSYNKISQYSQNVRLYN